MDVAARKKALRYFFQKIVDPLGYKFTPDEETADFLIEQEVNIERETGVPYCPCQGRTGNRQHDMQIVCPCIPYHREHFDAMKMCWCGLYVTKDVVAADLDKLRQISYEDFQRGARIVL
jgi:ferredoxin-thioredoxin reductase catalytic subunit